MGTDDILEWKDGAETNKLTFKGIETKHKTKKMEKDKQMQVTDRVGDLTKHKRMLGKLDYNARDLTLNSHYRGSKNKKQGH